MISYELAKQLKDAAFPQDGKGLCIHDNTVSPSQHYYAPTLEELIEACGKPFGQLFQFDLDKATEGRWGAVAQLPYWENVEGECVRVDASTPTEAVARLWLALSTKTV